MEPIQHGFFERSPVDCARDLIGCQFHWNGCSGRIVETEAYLDVDDPACHTWSRPSSRVFVDAHPAGAAYVYLNYGIHWMFNILAKSDHGSGFILFRALEPAAGLNEMRRRRSGVPDRMLMAGPGRLTRALGIDGSSHGADFLVAPDCGLFHGPPVAVVTGPRIGITKATELPWRFGDPASIALSRKFPAT